MTQAVTYERETKAVAFQGKIIVLESLTPVLPPKERESNDACRGYVIMAMENCGFSKKDIRRVVGQLYEVFDLNSVEDAKEKYLSSPY